MTPDGSVQWRRYTMGMGELLLNATLSSEEAAAVHDALRDDAGLAEAPSVGCGRSAYVLRHGQLAIKEFRTHVHFSPPFNGRFENLRVSVSITEALRGGLAVDKTDWVLKGVEYKGALIQPSSTEPTRWAMEYIDGHTLRKIRRDDAEMARKTQVYMLDGAMSTAAKLSGEDVMKVFADPNFGNYMVNKETWDRIAGAETGPFDLFRIDIGSMQ
jgi:hypothetical protein